VGTCRHDRHEPPPHHVATVRPEADEPPVLAPCCGRKTTAVPFRSPFWPYFPLHREEFLEHYRKRWNAESTFSMIKMTFSASVRSRNGTVQIDEALCKTLTHRLCVLTHSVCELGTHPSLGAGTRPCVQAASLPKNQLGPVFSGQSPAEREPTSGERPRRVPAQGGTRGLCVGAGVAVGVELIRARRPGLARTAVTLRCTGRLEARRRPRARLSDARVTV
jgi:hypothetical protein